MYIPYCKKMSSNFRFWAERGNVLVLHNDVVVYFYDRTQKTLPEGVLGHLRVALYFSGSKSTSSWYFKRVILRFSQYHIFFLQASERTID